MGILHQRPLTLPARTGAPAAPSRRYLGIRQTGPGIVGELPPRMCAECPARGGPRRGPSVAGPNPTGATAVSIAARVDTAGSIAARMRYGHRTIACSERGYCVVDRGARSMPLGRLRRVIAGSTVDYDGRSQAARPIAMGHHTQLGRLRRIGESSATDLPGAGPACAVTLELQGRGTAGPRHCTPSAPRERMGGI